MTRIQPLYELSQKLGKPVTAVQIRPAETAMAMAERHVGKGEAIVAKQCMILGKLRKMGLPTNMAEQLLAQCQRSQAFYIRHLNELKGPNSFPVEKPKEKDCAGAPNFPKSFKVKKTNKPKLALPASWEKHVKKERTVRLRFNLNDQELAAVNDWRFKTRMPSLAAAIRIMLKRGLAVRR